MIEKLPVPKAPTAGVKSGVALVESFMNLYLGVGIAVLALGLILFGGKRGNNSAGKVLLKIFVGAGLFFLGIGVLKDLPLISSTIQNNR